tara:strand:+ start:51 stop:512 length:462 start_codon:yes stop_codon:yes gene_type:complete
MFKNIFLWILIIFTISGCGYTPMYSSNFKSDFNIEIIDSKGDYDLSNFIKQKIIETPKNNNAYKNFQILISSAYIKQIQTKDKSGKVTQYSLNAEVDFTIKLNDKSETISFNEKSAMNKFNDDFEESSYERSFKENISQIFTNKLILYLSRKK